MEILILMLSSLLSLVAPTGVAVEQVARSTLRSQLVDAEELRVRIDNTPSHLIAQGQVDRVRIAGRGLFPLEGVRLDTLEMETDAIAFSLQRRGKTQLSKPLRAGIRLVLNQADMNRALRSPTIAQQLRKIGINVLNIQDSSQVERYELIDPQVDLLDTNRIRLQVKLREPQDPATLAVLMETGIQVVNGRQLRLVNPVARFNGETVPDRVMASLTDGIARKSDLRQLERSGVLFRLLQLKLENHQLTLAGLLQIAPDSPFLGKNRAR